LSVVTFDDRLVQIEQLQNTLLACATGGFRDYDGYSKLRRQALADSLTSDKLPRFVKSSGDLSQFWGFIKQKFATYQERRGYIWNEFRPLLAFLEKGSINPTDETVGETLSQLDREEVYRIWQRALDRRTDDSEGAITVARTLLETVCKHILDEAGGSYEEAQDLPALYRLVAVHLGIAPSQQSESVLKQICGGCHAVVEGLGALRNRLGDAHGKGSNAAKPEPRHAELAVNLAGAMAAFLVSTWISQKPHHSEYSGFLGSGLGLD
jgi:hypothetical protein